MRSPEGGVLHITRNGSDHELLPGRPPRVGRRAARLEPVLPLAVLVGHRDCGVVLDIVERGLGLQHCCCFLPLLWGEGGEEVGGDVTRMSHISRTNIEPWWRAKVLGVRSALSRNLAPGYLLGAVPLVVLPVVGDLEERHPGVDVHEEARAAVQVGLLADELVLPVVGRHARLGRREHLGGGVEGVGGVGGLGGGEWGVWGLGGGVGGARRLQGLP